MSNAPMQITRIDRSSPLRTSAIALAICLPFGASLAHAVQDAAPAKPAETTADAPAKAAALPKASDVIAKAAAALGGREAWSKVKSIEMKGTMEIPAANMKGTLTTKSVAPNLMSTSMDLPGFGLARQGFDGTTAWAADPSSGPRIVEGNEREMVVREANMLKDFELEKHWSSLETVGEGKFAGVDCWQISAKRGDDSATLWFEKETGLPRGSSMVVDTPFGKIPVTSEILEYREFSHLDAKGLKVGSRTESKQMGSKMIATVETVVFDQVDPKSLELPVEVKALLEPEPTEDEEEFGATEGGSKPAAPAAPATPAAPTTPAAPATPKA